MMSEDISGHSPSSPMPCEAEKDCEWMPWCKYTDRCLKKEMIRHAAHQTK